jgi:NTE family protein
MAKKLGFALGAGGSRGVAHIGFLKAMEEEGIIPDYISGCSMGSVVGACYSMGMSPDQMMTEINKLKFSDIFDLSINPLGNGALLRAKKMHKKLQTYLKDTTFDQLKRPFTCVATDLIEGKLVTFSGDTKVVDAVVASSSIPAIFRPKEVGDKVCVDGGVQCRVPIQQVRDMGAEVVIAVDVLGKVRKVEKKLNMIAVVFRVYDIMDSEATCANKNTNNPDLYIEPNLGDMVQFKFKDMDKAFEIGHQTGKEYAEKIKELIK